MKPQFKHKQQINLKALLDASGRQCLEQFNSRENILPWAKTFSEILILSGKWHAQSVLLSWKLKTAKTSRLYFKLQVARYNEKNGKQSLLLPTVVALDGDRIGELVTSRSKYRPSGQRFSSSLCGLARSGLLPTPTTANNRNSRNAVQRIGNAHQCHGLSLGLAQVMEIAMGLLPMEFDDWQQVPAFYKRLLPTPLSKDHIGGRHPEKLKSSGRKPSNSLGDTINAITGQCSRLSPLFVLEMMGFPAIWTLIPFLKAAS